MLLQQIPYSVKHFTHVAHNKMFIAEHSELRISHYKPLYDDAADVGIAVCNEDTRGLTHWFLSRQEHDDEGELKVDILEPAVETLRRFPQLQGYTMHILND